MCVKIMSYLNNYCTSQITQTFSCNSAAATITFKTVFQNNDAFITKINIIIINTVKSYFVGN